MSQSYSSNCFSTANVIETDMQNVENNFDALRSLFSGSSAPTSPDAVNFMERIMERAQCHSAVVAMAVNLVKEAEKQRGPFTREEMDVIFWETIDSEKEIYSRDPGAYLKYAASATKPKPEDVEGATKVEVTHGRPAGPIH